MGMNIDGSILLVGDWLLSAFNLPVLAAIDLSTVQLEVAHFVKLILNFKSFPAKLTYA